MSRTRAHHLGRVLVLMLALLAGLPARTPGVWLCANGGICGACDDADLETTPVDCCASMEAVAEPAAPSSDAPCESCCYDAADGVSPRRLESATPQVFPDFDQNLAIPLLEHGSLVERLPCDDSPLPRSRSAPAPSAPRAPPHLG